VKAQINVNLKKLQIAAEHALKHVGCLIVELLVDKGGEVEKEIVGT